MNVDLNVGNLIEPIRGRRWDPAEVARQVDSRARAFRAAGLGGGDRAFLHFGNRLEFFADLLAIWRIGACAVPIDGRLTAYEVETLARAAAPRLSIVDDTTGADVVAAVAKAGATAVSSVEIGAAPAAAAAGGRERGARLDDEALILFTSGSTGQPKGVVHTHRSLRARWLTLRQSLGLEAYRRTLCLLPTHFGHGLICNCLFPWLSGADLHIAPPFKPELILRLGALIDEHEITFLSSVPALWRLALRAAKPPGRGSLRRVHGGSAPRSGPLWEEIREWAATPEVWNAYGITETGSWVAGTSLPGFTPEDGLIGEPWGAVIRILSTRETGAFPGPEALCRPGEAGYVWIDTPALMKGYLDRDDLTDAAVCAGWFMTGDVGLLDERGRLHLKGRERDEINKGGMKVYPSDVDAVVERFGRARDVCTFGIDDPLYGQNVAMAVTLADREDATLRDLHAWMKQHLAEHKMPVRWWVVDEIPRTSRGKLNRDAVKERCGEIEPLDLARVLRIASAAER